MPIGECVRSELVMGEDQEPLDLFTPCGCKIAFCVLFWIPTLLTLLVVVDPVGMRRRHRLNQESMCIVAIGSFIVLVLTFLEASANYERLSKWRCVPIGTVFFPWYSLCGILVVYLDQRTDPGHLHGLNLRRRRQG